MKSREHCLPSPPELLLLAPLQLWVAGTSQGSLFFLSLQYHRVNEQRLRLSFGLLAQSPHSCTVVRPCPAPTENNCEALIDLTWVLDWAH